MTKIVMSVVGAQIGDDGVVRWRAEFMVNSGATVGRFVEPILTRLWGEHGYGWPKKKV